MAQVEKKITKLDLSNQKNNFKNTLNQFDTWKNLLAQRKPIYDSISEEKRKIWRESKSDSVLYNSWIMFQELAKFFEVEINK